MVKRAQIRPPRLATVVLTLVVGRPERACLLGDLTEEFTELALARGWNAAARWYWQQALRSAGPLLAARLSSRQMARSLGATFVGAVTAIVSATFFGGVLGRLLDLDTEAALGVIMVMTTSCALVSSTCAGWASTSVSGGPYSGATVLIGLIVVAPDIVYAVRHQGADGQPWVLLPLCSAILATCAGLVLGGKLGRLNHLPS